MASDHLKTSLQREIQAWLNGTRNPPREGVELDTFISEELARAMTEAAWGVFKGTLDIQTFLKREGFWMDI